MADDPRLPSEPADAILDEKPVSKEAAVDTMAEEDAAAEAAVRESSSFKEESNLVSDLSGLERSALYELRRLVATAVKNGEFSAREAPAVEAEAPREQEAIKNVVEDQILNEEAEQKAATGDEDDVVTVEAIAETVTVTATGDDEEEEVVKKELEDDIDPEAKTVEVIEETATVAAASVVAGPETTKGVPLPASTDSITLWGVPLIENDVCNDTILLKFLRAREFKPKDAFVMLKSTLGWRRSFGIEQLLDADLDFDEMENVVFYSGTSREGHPVCYNVFGSFSDKELYEKAFGDEEKRMRFLKWRIRFLEKGIREKLDFCSGGVCSMVQVIDLNNSPPLLGKHRTVTRQAVTILQDNYPEFIAKKVFINVPWWYIATNRMISPFLTQRTKSKFIFAGSSRSVETLFRYISPEQVPVQFGGLFVEHGQDFNISDPVEEINIKPTSSETIEIPLSEMTTAVWELRVIGWEVRYGAEFVPEAREGYTVIVQKTRRLLPNDEPVIRGIFKTGEPGRVVLTISNPASKKKLLIYRFKVSPCQSI